MTPNRSRQGRGRVFRRVVAGLVRHRIGTSALALALGLVAGGPLAGILLARDSALLAVRSAVAAQFFAGGHALQTGDAATARALDAEPGVRRSALADVTLSRAGRRVAAQLRVIDLPDTLTPHVDAGRLPQRPGEVSLPAHLRDELDAQLGQVLTVTVGGRSSPATLVGVTRTQDARDDSLTLAVDPARLGLPTTTWYLPADAPIDRWLASESISLDSADRAIARVDDSPPSLVRGLDQLAGVVWLPLSTLAAVGLTPLLPSWRRDVRLLRAAGVAPRTAWAAVRAATAGAVAAGVLAGTAAAWVLLAVATRPVSHALGADWTQVAPPGPLLGAVAAAPVVVALALPVILRLGGALRARRTGRRARAGVPVEVAATAAVVAGVVAALALRAADAGVDPRRTMTAVVAATIGASVLAAGGCGVGAGRAVRAVAEVAARHGLLAGAAVLTVAGGAAGFVAFSGWTSSALDQAFGDESLPRDALVARRVATPAADALAARWHTTRLLDTTSDAGPVMVVSRRSADCVAAGGLLLECVTDGPFSPLVIDPSANATDVSARVTDHGGLVAVAVRRERAILLGPVHAQPGPDLGTDLPDVRLAPTDPLVASGAVRPAGIETVLVRDVPLQREDALRADVRELAPGADVSVSAQQLGLRAMAAVNRALALGVAVVAAAGAATVGALGLTAARPTRRDLVRLGMGGGRRARLGGRAFAPLLGGGLAAGVLTPLAVRLAGPLPGGDLGWWWVLPPAAVVSVGLVAAALFARPVP